MYPFVPLKFEEKSSEEMQQNSAAYYQKMLSRKTVREFSDKPVPFEIIQNCVLTAGLAPNGANLQPWHFVIIQDAAVKTQIRKAAEVEEKEFYDHLAPKAWLDALAPLATDEHKPFLETAPYLIAIFSKSYELLPNGEKLKHYYVNESVGIATGFLISAVHHAGLVSLTHTPSPMGFLNEILHRPSHEKPFLLLVVGYPAESATIPDIHKKEFTEISSRF